MEEIYHKRIKKLRDELSLDNGEAYLTSTKEDVLYLTGFLSSNSNFIITKNSQKIFTDKRYTQQIKELKSKIESEFIDKNLNESLKNFCTQHKIKKIYFEPTKFSFQKITELRKLGDVKIKALKKDISFIFANQDEYSIKKTKLAIKITERIFSDILKQITEGVSEKDLKGELKYLITKFSDGEAFEPIVLFGKNTAYPHGVSSNTKLKINQPILFDFGVNLNGYNSDFTRTIFFGKPSDEFKKKYEIVKSALDLAIEKLEVNQEAKNLANVVIEYFKNFGIEKNFTHALGHGLGVYLHNFPLLSHKSNHRIPDNIILALEPALYFEGKFGIRIEQNILLYNGKKELLTKTKDELIIL